jgi:hypothetical protein
LKFLSNNQGFNHVCIDVMKLSWELAGLSKNARLCTLDRMSAMRRRWAAVTVDAPNILTAAAIDTWCHAGDETEGGKLICCRLVGVLMGTGCVVRTFVAEKVHVTHLHLLDTVHLRLIVIFTRRIDSLSVAVARYDLFSIDRLINRRLCNWWRRSCSLRSPAS